MIDKEDRYRRYFEIIVNSDNIIIRKDGREVKFSKRNLAKDIENVLNSITSLLKGYGFSERENSKHDEFHSEVLKYLDKADEEIVNEVKKRLSEIKNLLREIRDLLKTAGEI